MDKNLTTPGTVITSTQPPAPADPGSKEDLGIPHHLQDKRGFCGAACMMMLLGYQGKETSQSELMRRIKSMRDENRTENGEREGPPSGRVAWHASPEEIADVMSVMADRPWGAAQSMESEVIMNSIDASLNSGFGAIALVWSATLNTRLPHWVVVSGKSPDVASGKRTGYWILDPTAAGRADGGGRYESLKHKLIKESDLCPCQSWKDSHGAEQTAQRIWVSNSKLEEMLDDGAVKGNGLRYAIVYNKVQPRELSDGSKPPDVSKANPGPAFPYVSNLSTTVEEKIAAKKAAAEAEVFASKFKSLTVTIREPGDNLPN